MLEKGQMADESVAAPTAPPTASTFPAGSTEQGLKEIRTRLLDLTNRNKLLKFLPDFLADRTDDEQFSDEKSFLIRQIETMPSSPTPPSAPQMAGAGSAVNSPSGAGTAT